MDFKNVKYKIPIYRVLIIGFMLIFCGIFSLILIYSRFIYELEYFDIFFLPILAFLSIISSYFGIKKIVNCNKFTQLELLDKEIKYLIVGKGKGSGLNYFFNPTYKSIEYKDIIYANIVKVDLFDKKIQLLLKNNYIIELSFLYNDICELEDVLNEIRKRIK